MQTSSLRLLGGKQVVKINSNMLSPGRSHHTNAHKGARSPRVRSPRRRSQRGSPRSPRRTHGLQSGAKTFVETKDMTSMPFPEVEQEAAVVGDPIQELLKASGRRRQVRRSVNISSKACRSCGTPLQMYFSAQNVTDISCAACDTVNRFEPQELIAYQPVKQVVIHEREQAKAKTYLEQMQQRRQKRATEGGIAPPVHHQRRVRDPGDRKSRLLRIERAAEWVPVEEPVQELGEAVEPHVEPHSPGARDGASVSFDPQVVEHAVMVENLSPKRSKDDLPVVNLAAGRTVDLVQLISAQDVDDDNVDDDGLFRLLPEGPPVAFALQHMTSEEQSVFKQLSMGEQNLYLGLWYTATDAEERFLYARTKMSLKQRAEVLAMIDMPSIMNFQEKIDFVKADPEFKQQMLHVEQVCHSWWISQVSLGLVVLSFFSVLSTIVLPLLTFVDVLEPLIALAIFGGICVLLCVFEAFVASRVPGGPQFLKRYAKSNALRVFISLVVRGDVCGTLIASGVLSTTAFVIVLCAYVLLMVVPIVVMTSPLRLPASMEHALRRLRRFVLASSINDAYLFARMFRIRLAGGVRSHKKWAIAQQHTTTTTTTTTPPPSLVEKTNNGEVLLNLYRIWLFVVPTAIVHVLLVLSDTHTHIPLLSMLPYRVLKVVAFVCMIGRTAMLGHEAHKRLHPHEE